MNQAVVHDISQQFADQGADELLRWAFEQFDDVVISFSGAEDVVLIDLATKLGIKPKVMTLDTGRLHAETYAFIEKVRQHYDIDIDVVSPDAEALQAFVKAKGLFSFYQDGHQECCAIRKVAPLKKALKNKDAWITGQRKDQSPNTRNEVKQVEDDRVFAAEDKTLVKLNPLANWTSAEVWQYIRDHDVPYNALHEQGFISIGCQPCTRPVLPNAHEREGRWWWEESTKKECGLHPTQDF